MGSTFDFLGATIADALSPKFRRPVEDIIYETIDRKQIPTRTDFTELRNVVNSLRSQTTGSTRGITKLKEGLDEIEESIHDLQTELVDLKTQVAQLTADNQSLKARLTNDNSANDFVSTEMQNLLNRLDALENAQSAAQSAKTRSPDTNEDSACRVDGCADKPRGKGFCARHYAKWRRGTLKGFVAYDGTVTINKQVITVDEQLIGSPFTVTDDGIDVNGHPYPMPG